MRKPYFEEYLFDSIQDVLTRVISDLENLMYDLSILEAMKDERMLSLFGDCSFSYSDFKAESEENKNDL